MTRSLHLTAASLFCAATALSTLGATARAGTLAWSKHAASDVAPAAASSFLPDESWSPDDKASESFGKIHTAPDRLTLGDQDFPLQRIEIFGTRGNADAATLFSTDAGGGVRSGLFRIRIPADTKVKGNPVCGSADVNWAVVLIEGNEMRLGLFSGQARPNLNPKLIKNSHSVCSTMSFSRK